MQLHLWLRSATHHKDCCPASQSWRTASHTILNRRHASATFGGQALLQGARLHLRDVDGLQRGAAVHGPGRYDALARARHQRRPWPARQARHPTSRRLGLREGYD